MIDNILDKENSGNEVTLLRELLGNIFESSDIQIIARDLNERLILINDKESKILKIPKNQALGKTPHELYPHEVADNLVQHDKQVLQEGKACQSEEKILIDGKLHTVLFNKFPLRDNSGNIFGVGVITTDITQLREAQDALERQDAFLRIIFDKSSVGMTIMDLDGKIYRVNSAYEQITGYSEQEIKSKGLTLFTCARDVKEENSLIREVARHLSDSYRIDRRIICKDGTLKWVHLTGSVLFSQETARIFTTMEDITEKKILDRKLEKYRLALEDLLQQRTTQLLDAKRDTLVSNAAGLVGQQLLLKYIFRKEPQDT
jgi:PAS domain S-box-containing protein